MGLIFQVPVQYCSLQHWILLSPPDISTTEHHFCFGPVILFLLELLVIAFCSFPVAYCMLSNLGSSPTIVHIFLTFHIVHGVLQEEFGVGCYFLLQWITFFENSSLWPIHLGWPCMARLMASLSYESPFTTRSLWSMKGKWPTTRFYFQSLLNSFQHNWSLCSSIHSSWISSHLTGHPLMLFLCWPLPCLKTS